MERRKFLKAAGLVTAAAYVSPKIFADEKSSIASSVVNFSPAFEFPALPYAYNALEPYIDARTMEIHYDKHHRAYFTNFVNAVKGTPLETMTLTEIFASMSKQSDAVRNNGGGFYNHVFFWNSLGKGSTGPSAELSAAINKAFGSFDKFKETFNTAAKTRFGSGWAWLIFKRG